MAQEKRTENYVTSLVIYDPVGATTEPVTGEKLTNSTPMDVKIVDGDGSQIVSFFVSTPTSFNGGPVTVGTSAVEMTFTGTTKALSIQSDHDNTGIIWFGGATIDNTGANALGRLAAGQSVTIEMDDASSAIYAVSDTATQTVFKIAVT